MGAFDGHTAIITGARQGIGAGVALRLAREGASLALLDIGDCDETFSAAEALGAVAFQARCDVRSAADIDRAVGAASELLGTPSLAVGCAGVIQTAAFLELREEDWDRTIDVNLKGSTFFLQSVARRMVAGNVTGSVVLLSSTAAKAPRPTAADYSASKLGMISVTRSAAVALAPHGINVNTVCPGVVANTPMTVQLHEQRAKLVGITADRSLASMLEQIPLERLETVDDVVKAVVFLLSSDAEYITGQSLNVCGGLQFD